MVSISFLSFVGYGGLERVWQSVLVRETGTGLNGKVIKHKKWREVSQLRCAHRSPDPRPGALSLLDGKEYLADSSREGHVTGGKLFLRQFVAVPVDGGWGPSKS